MFCPKFNAALTMKYKHVIWDWNGTLLNDRWLCVEGINAALIKRGLPVITEKTYRDVFTFPVEEYYKKVGFDFEKEPFRIAGDEFVFYYEQHFQRTELHLDSVSTLDAISASGRTQSILSAGKQEFLNDWVNNHGLSDYFINVLGIDNQYARGKTELGVAWIKELPYKPQEVIMIGDTIHDSEVAKAMNIECLLVDHGHVNRERLQKTGQPLISNLNQVVDVLD